MGDTDQQHAEDDGWQWAIVEIFGHRKHAGRTREEERFGAKMLRIDVPIDGDPAKGWTTIYYGGSSDCGGDARRPHGQAVLPRGGHLHHSAAGSELRAYEDRRTDHETFWPSALHAYDRVSSSDAGRTR